MVDRCERVQAVHVDPLQDPDHAGAGPVADQMIELARAVVVKGENSVPIVTQIEAADPDAGVTLVVDGSERVRAVVAADLLQDPDGACSGPVADQVIELVSAIVVKGENLVPDVGKVVAGDPLAGVSLVVNRCKRVRAVVVADLLQDPNSACSGPVAGEMIELASAIVVKGESSVPDVGKVVAGDPSALVDGRERVQAASAADLLQYENGACTGPVADQVVELASAAVIKGENLVPPVAQV